jgi:hypothetical protein
MYLRLDEKDADTYTEGFFHADLMPPESRLNNACRAPS